MKMKNITSTLIVVLIATVSSPVMAMDGTHPKIAETTENRVEYLQNRLEEIRSIDKKALTHAEKKELRHEVKAIKKELAGISGGVYLSVGAIILIALLLILLL